MQAMTGNRFANISNDELKGYLKAAEANERLKEIKMKNRKQETRGTKEIINFQPTALEAIRLQILTKPLRIKRPEDPLTKIERARLDKLFEETRLSW